MNQSETKTATDSILLSNKDSEDFLPFEEPGDSFQPDLVEDIDREIRSGSICEEQAKYIPNQIENKEKKRLKCPACPQLCARRNNLVRHIQRAHQSDADLLKQVTADYCIACLLCEQRFSHIRFLKAHLTETHEVVFDEQEYTFENIDEFFDWKAEVELQTDSIYIKQTGDVVRNDDRMYSYFKCNRSGYYKTKLSPSNRKRRLKGYGTVKMNSHCTSVMKVVHCRSGELQVYFCATHYGHDGFKECREKLLENSNGAPKRIKIKDSKMIRPPLEPLLSSEDDIGLINTHCFTDITNCPIELINIIDEDSENIECKDDFLTYSEPCDGSAVPIGNQLRAIPFADNDGNMIVSAFYTGESRSPSKSSVDETEEDASMAAEHCLPPTKRKLVSNLQKLFEFIENCQSDVVMDLLANNVEEIVDKYTPFIDWKDQDVGIAAIDNA